VKAAQMGRRKIATTNFTQRVGTISGYGAGTARVVRKTCLFDFRFLAAKITADYADSSLSFRAKSRNLLLLDSSPAVP